MYQNFRKAKIAFASRNAGLFQPVISASVKPNGDGEIRTHDPLLARQVLSQLSYTPI